MNLWRGLSVGLLTFNTLNHASFAAQLYCQANGSEAIVTKIDGDVKLGTHYFSSMADCRKAVLYSSYDLVCTANAIGEAIPTRISDGERIGRFYFGSINSCIKATVSARNGLVCSADDGLAYYAITRVSDEKTVGPMSSRMFEHCEDAVRTSTRTKVCVFDGNGNYAPAEIDSRKILGSYSDLDGCVARL